MPGLAKIKLQQFASFREFVYNDIGSEIMMQELKSDLKLDPRNDPQHL